jgi:small subunit ribosomal protein S9
MAADKIVVISGKRKMSIARASIKKGNGTVRINKTNLNVLIPETARSKMSEPIWLAGDLAKGVNIDVIVAGGGVMSQAEAVRNAIARALVAFTNNKELKKQFIEYDRHLLIADIRRTEPHKPCRSAARRSKQTSKR